MTDPNRRARRGRLTADDVALVRVLHSRGTAQAALADEFGVSVSTISDVVHRRTWRHVADLHADTVIEMRAEDIEALGTAAQ
jgi:hypothetical protein